MSERQEAAQVALRCEQCNKPFEKPSTLKRHGYYCRSRRLGRTVRSRSCIACARGKARCDNSQPSCSRCAQKAIQCRYPPAKQASSNNTASSTLAAPFAQPGTIANSEQDNVSAGGDVNVAFGSSAPVTTTTTPELSWSEEPQLLSNWNERELASLVQTIDWEDTGTIDFADFLHDQTSNVSPAVLHYADHQSLNTQQQETSPYNISSIPAVPSTYTLRSLIARPTREPGQSRIANLVFQTLKSYPLMIIRHNTLPPFIHPYSISFHDDENDKDNMESLANALSLMHMLGSKIHGSRKLFWKNVRWECERMREQHAQMNKWQLLAAMQALSVYLLVRLQEGETEHNNYDSLMLATVIMIASDFARTESSGCDLESIISISPSIQQRWEAWVFLESRRRLAVIYRIINLLLYFEPAYMCTLQSDLIIAPLPAKKSLWEAGSARDWSEALAGRREPSHHHIPASSPPPLLPTLGNGIKEKSLALAADGGLVQLDDGQVYCSQGELQYQILSLGSTATKAADWEDWCAGMDGFGGLVMLAAELVV